MARVALVVPFLLLSVLPAGAQDLLFEGGRQIGAIGRFGRDLGPSPALVHNPLIGGGRFVINGDVAVDWQAGTSVSLGPGFVVGFDRARPRVFMARPDGVWDVDVVTGISLLVLPVPTTDLVACGHAHSADVPLCVFTRADGRQDIVRPGPGGPELVLTTRFASIAPLNWVVTPDATRIYFERCTDSATVPGVFCVESDLAVFDLRTGVLTTIGRPWPFDPPGRFVWDEVHERLLTVAARVEVYSRDLARLGGATVGGACRQLAISPHTGRVYLSTMEHDSTPIVSSLTAFNSTTYQVLVPAVPRSTGSCGPLTLLTAPGAPRSVQAVVAGRTVTLTWTNVGAASGFAVDVGFAPGRTDLSMLLGPEAMATFTDVPHGTYYLRLRGGNAFGGGNPSREIAVTVP
jgi:hypothetical protein